MGGKNKYIHSFSIDNLWNRLKLTWNDIYPDVNIIVGINGSGKTTLLNCIFDYYNSKKSSYKCEGTPLEIPVYFIRSFDVPLTNRKKKDSPLYQELEKVVFQSPDSKLNFFNYRFRTFLSMYSSAVYLPFLYLLNTMRLKRRGLNRTDFHAAISEHFEVDDERDNGLAAVNRIRQRLNALVDALPARFMNIDVEKAKYETMGVKEDTAYLFVRGHCLYDYLCALGKHLCLGTDIDFESQVLKRSLSGYYTEKEKIATDMRNLR